jgi:3-deoxy-D-manno-octulosonic-acid transferase
MIERLARWGYALMAHAMVLPALVRLYRRGQVQPGYREQVGQRFGRYGADAPLPTPPDQPCLWLHAVSVGEVRAAQPLVQAIRETWPGRRIMLTVGTPTGRDTARDLFGERVSLMWAPYDLPWALAAFFKRYRPQAVWVMETEVWPNQLAACAARGVPVALVNARLSEKSAAGYAKHAALFRPAFAKFAAVLAQSEADATRLRAVGATTVSVMGNVKFDAPDPTAATPLADRFRQWIGTRPVVLLSSTREGEEALLLDALETQLARGTLLLIVPRHPQRFDEVTALARARGLRVQRRSAQEPLAADTQVWIGDSMGELAAYSAACDIAVIGGSWLAFGAQSPIDAFAAAKPVLIGPHSYNFAEVTREACAAGAAQQLADTHALSDAVSALLDNPDRGAAMGAAGYALALQSRGATARAMRVLTSPAMR